MSLDKKLYFVIGLLIVFCGIIYGIKFISWGYEMYDAFSHLFLFSKEQVVFRLDNEYFKQCSETICPLITGDILIRRQITKRTWLIDKLFHPYFTHSAFFSGNDLIAEAGGHEKNREDEIILRKFSESDWKTMPSESWVIIRPKIPQEIKNKLEMRIREISDNPLYSFGLFINPYLETNKRSCADLIVRALRDERIIPNDHLPKIITPDFLFSLVDIYPNTFEILMYGTGKLP